jgi:hypothetical protein
VEVVGFSSKAGAKERGDLLETGGLIVPGFGIGDGARLRSLLLQKHLFRRRSHACRIDLLGNFF